MADIESMSGLSFVVILSGAMFFGSYFAGQIPLLFTMSESRLRLVTIFGAGLLVGTALSVIVPEGVEALYASQRELISLHSHDSHLSHETKNLLESNVQAAPQGARIIPKDANLNEGLAPPNVGEGDGKVKREVQKETPSLFRKLFATEDHAGEEEKHHEHHEDIHKHGNIHSSIGYSLVCGFIFMLLVDQIGNSTINRGERSGRMRMSISATIGLVVHAAADGIALGSASVINRSDVQLIVFIAIMLHKGPSAFGLVSFLLMEGLDKSRVKKHLLVFSFSAPISAVLTYVLLSNVSPDSASSSSSTTGILMLFSAGTFLYVSTVHVLPELTQQGTGQRDYTLVDLQSPSTAGHSHSAGPAFSMKELGTIIAGSIIPAILASGHSH